MNTDRLKSILVAVATIGVIVFNWLAAVGYVNGVTPAEISNKYPTLITPAGYAFSIWSLIYIGLIAFTIYQMLPALLERFRSVRSLYILSCLLNCAWIYFWHHDNIAVSFVVIAALAVTLVLITIKLRRDPSTGVYWYARAPFGIYAGWVTAATIVNFTILLVASGVIKPGMASESGYPWLGPVLILTAAAFGVAARVALQNYFFPLAVAWALTAIAIKQTGQTWVIAAAAAGVVACLVAALSFVVNLPSSADRNSA
jgi:hypothetical protein